MCVHFLYVDPRTSAVVVASVTYILLLLYHVVHLKLLYSHIFYDIKTQMLRRRTTPPPPPPYHYPLIIVVPVTVGGGVSLAAATCTLIASGGGGGGGGGGTVVVVYGLPNDTRRPISVFVGVRTAITPSTPLALLVSGEVYIDVIVRFQVRLSMSRLYILIKNYNNE